MGAFSIGHWIIILVIILVIFGAGKLPEVGRGLGKGIKEFKKASREGGELDVTPTDATKKDQIEK